MCMGRRVVKTVHSLILLLIVSTSTALSLGGTPLFPDPWTSRSRHGAGWSAPEKSSSSSELDPLDSNSQARLDLEGKAAREIRESFGDEFARQLDEEREILRRGSDRKAQIGREAGCSETSPLSSSSLHRAGVITPGTSAEA